MVIFLELRMVQDFLDFGTVENLRFLIKTGKKTVANKRPFEVPIWAFTFAATHYGRQQSKEDRERMVGMFFVASRYVAFSRYLETINFASLKGNRKYTCNGNPESSNRGIVLFVPQTKSSWI